MSTDDDSTSDEFEFPAALTLARWNDILEWGLSELDLKYSIEKMLAFAQNIASLPISARRFLCETVLRLDRYPTDDGRYSYYGLIWFDDVARTSELNNYQIKNAVEFLKHKDFIDTDIVEGVRKIVLCETEDGGFTWGDLRVFCERAEIPLSDIIVDLKFVLMD